MHPTTRVLAIGTIIVGLTDPASAADSWTDPAPGIRLLKRTTTGPNQRIHAAYTSLCTSGIRVDARSPQATRITTQAWGSAMGATLAVNGDFYRTDRTIPTVYGDAAGQGIRWPIAQTGRSSEFANEWYYGDYGWIAFGDGWVEYNHSGYVKDRAAALGITQGYLAGKRTTAIPAGTLALVSGFPELVVEGTRRTSFPERGDCADRHPRTAMGLTEDRSELILVTVDGRSTSAAGMTCAELATLMKGLGAYTAFNLDGGGSTQMYVAGRGTINVPSDGTPRAVANHWGVFAEDTTAPRSCFQAGGCFPSAVPSAAGARFGDLPDDAVGATTAARAVDDGYIEACQAEPAMFCPNCGLSRRDAIALVVRAAGLDTSSAPAAPSFSDVPSDAEAFAEIEAALAAGLTTGCGDGKLCPDDVVTRGEVAALVARARAWGVTGDAPALDDVPEDHAYSSEIAAVVSRCAASRCASGGFCPDDAATRSDGVQLAGAAFGFSTEAACDDSGDGSDGQNDPDDVAGADAGGCAASSGGLGWCGALLALVLVLGRSKRRARASR